MLKRFLPIFTFLVAATTLAAQVAEPAFIPPPTFEPRSVQMCTGAANAGTTTRTLGLGAKSNEKHYLCLGDTLFVGSNSINLTEDPIPATPAGIGYLFYKCKINAHSN